jgi:hypothetical protein
MTYYLPVEKGCEALVLDALVDLLTAKCQTEIDTGDVSRAQIVKAGPRQAAPEAVSILIHENDPDGPTRWPHRPMPYRAPRPGGRPAADPFSVGEGTRSAVGRVMMGGGSTYALAYLLEMEVFGLYVSSDVDVDREEVRDIAAVAKHRMVQAVLEAGRHIGTGDIIEDDLGMAVIAGPFVDRMWTDPEEGESLIIRKYVRFWYRASWDYDW